jgi:hypothetical protein
MDIKELNLKKFEAFGAKISRKISITASSSFGFPPTFYKENNLDKYTHAVLFYDQNARVVGIHFTSDKPEGAFKLIIHGKDDKISASFVARSFFNTYGLIASGVKGRYEYSKIDQEGIGEIYLIELKEIEAVKIKKE